MSLKLSPQPEEKGTTCTTVKRKRTDLTLQRKIDIINAFEADPTLKQSDIALTFGIKKQTIHDIMASKSTLKEAFDAIGCDMAKEKKRVRFMPEETRIDEIESFVLQWMKSNNSSSTGISGSIGSSSSSSSSINEDAKEGSEVISRDKIIEIAKAKASSLCDEISMKGEQATLEDRKVLDQCSKFAGSNAWLNSFIKAYNIETKKSSPSKPKKLESSSSINSSNLNSNSNSSTSFSSSSESSQKSNGTAVVTVAVKPTLGGRAKKEGSGKKTITTTTKTQLDMQANNGPSLARQLLLGLDPSDSIASTYHGQGPLQGHWMENSTTASAHSLDFLINRSRISSKHSNHLLNGFDGVSASGFDDVSALQMGISNDQYTNSNHNPDLMHMPQQYHQQQLLQQQIFLQQHHSNYPLQFMTMRHMNMQQMSIGDTSTHVIPMTYTGILSRSSFEETVLPVLLIADR